MVAVQLARGHTAKLNTVHREILASKNFRVTIIRVEKISQTEAFTKNF